MNNTRVTLAQVCDELSDGLHKAPVFNPSGEYLFVNATNLENGYIVDKGEGKRADYSEYLKYAIELNENTILYSIDGTIGNIARYRGEKCILGKGACYLNVKDSVCADYIYYLLQSSYFTGYIASMSTGSTIHHISLETMRKFSFDLPPYETQKAIGGILATLDQKIHNNSLVCAELESMAKTMYDYWFVQFDFPDANGKPYRASGGEMVWNEQLKREIPKGWEIASINAMTTSYRGVSYDKNDLLPSSENGVLVLRGNNIQNNRLVYDRNVAYVPHSFVSKEQQIRAHDIILTMSSGSKEHIGKCTRFQYDSPHTYGAFLTKFTPDTDKVGFVYLSMISEFFKKKIKAICNGTGINNLTNETFDNLVFPNPTASVLKQFEKTVAPILEKMGSCEKENETLISLRDWLLPMLMNGQATVAPAEPAPKLQVLQPEKPARDPRFDRWLQTQGVAARGTVDEQTLHDIFDAMDDDDKQ